MTLTRDAMPDATSLVESLLRHAGAGPERVAFTFLDEDDRPGPPLTYGALDTRARAIAAVLQRQGARGERALLLYQPGLEFVCAFFGCLYAGVIAVPVYPPDPTNIARSLARFRHIARSSQAAFVLSTAEIAALARPLLADDPELSGLRWLASDEATADGAPMWRPYAPTTDSVAFLQYTSGSTAAPKGVMVSHGNLMHNVHAIRRTCGLTAADIGVSWLPVYHDMGLIGCILSTVYTGFFSALMSPVAFIKRPARWLEALSRFRATYTGAPNFAYELAVRKTTAEDRRGYDLSAMRGALNGGEPLRAATLERFVAAFAPCGLSPTVPMPVFGIAEATLMVAVKPAGVEPTALRVRSQALAQQVVATADDAPGDAAVILVSLGRVVDGHEVQIVDAEGRPLAEDRVGEVWVAGPSIARGYWSQKVESERTFRATLPDRPGARFMRTGDLGFLHGGELFICGRIKDLIIVSGRNLYPQDLELTVEQASDLVRPGCVAAFTVDGAEGDERVVVTAELAASALAGADPAALSRRTVDAIRRRIAEVHEVEAHAVVLVRQGTIPKTSSGKIQRQACRAGYEDGGLDEIDRG